jgi:transposase
LRLEYQLIMWAIETNNLVFIDESGTNLNMARTYARAKKGRRAHGSKPHNKGKNLTIIAAIAITGVLAALSFFGSNNAITFLFYVTEVLVPQLNDTMVVVMDNLNLHCSDEVRTAIENTGAKLIFLPTYSPDLSPIEMFWSKVKSILRSIAPRTTEQLHAAITLAFNSVSESDFFGWFYECDARTTLI